MEYNELYHHGIRGQRWGVRRYQNEDGSRTSRGKKRQSDRNENKKSVKEWLSNNKGKIVAVTSAAGAVALTAYMLKHPDTANKIINKCKSFTVSKGPKVKDFMISNSKKLVNHVGDTTKKAGKAMEDAALVSFGSIQIAKLSKKLETSPDATQEEKDRNKLILDTATAGIRAATNAQGSGNNKSGTKQGGNVGSQITSVIGKPSNQNIDRSSLAWQSLFKDSNGNQRSVEARSTIKSMANAGYDIEQIREALNKNLIHGGLIMEQNYNELYHHGVLGMKWGVRKYQNADGTLTKLGKKRYDKADKQEEKGKNAKTFIGRNYHLRNAAKMRAELKTGQKAYDSLHKFKILDAYKYRHSHEAGKIYGDELSKASKQISERSKTKFFKKAWDASSKNYKYLADYNDKMSKSSFGDRVLERIVPVERLRTPYQRISGRTTTRGKEALSNYYTADIAGHVLDAKYVYGKKKKEGK